jgi:hypothetical protein
MSRYTKHIPESDPSPPAKTVDQKMRKTLQLQMQAVMFENESMRQTLAEQEATLAAVVNKVEDSQTIAANWHKKVQDAVSQTKTIVKGVINNMTK